MDEMKQKQKSQKRRKQREGNREKNRKEKTEMPGRKMLGKQKKEGIDAKRRKEIEWKKKRG